MSMSSSETLRNNFDNQVKEHYRVEDITLKPCNICGRTFNPQSLRIENHGQKMNISVEIKERHEKVCEKTRKCIRRNVFNSFSQRAKEIGVVPVVNETKEDKKKCKKGKEEHENAVRTVRSEKNSNVMNNGLAQQKKALSGYQQCPSCNRCFSQKAADRHIVWCTEQQTRLPKTPPSSEALERLKARVKYRAPLPKRKGNNDSNIRLVKSAESVREPTKLRTHSSPPIPVCNIRPSRLSSENSNTTILKTHTQNKVEEETVPTHSNNIDNPEQNSNVTTEVQSKKAVKFKEIFPVYKKDRNKNLDMLAALRLRLSELETSDELLDDCFMKPNENELLRSHSKKCNFSTAAHVSREIWTSDGEVHCSTSSSSEGSLPSLNGAGSSEQRMPRFCYNCGTKYPIVSAKFCCECGARRFVFGANNQFYAP